MLAMTVGTRHMLDKSQPILDQWTTLPCLEVRLCEEATFRKLHLYVANMFVQTAPVTV